MLNKVAIFAAVFIAGGIVWEIISALYRRLNRAVTTRLSRRWARLGVIGGDEKIGRTAASPSIILIIWLSGSCLFADAFYFVLNIPRMPHDFLVNSGVALLSVIVLVCGVSLTSLHRWEWDTQGISWKGVLRSRSLQWPTITKLGYSWIRSSFYVSDHQNRRVYWSYQRTFQSDRIIEAVKTRRPELFANASKGFRAACASAG